MGGNNVVGAMLALIAFGIFATEKKMIWIAE